MKDKELDERKDFSHFMVFLRAKINNLHSNKYEAMTQVDEKTASQEDKVSIKTN